MNITTLIFNQKESKMKKLIYITTILLLTGCANSASHEVITQTKLSDNGLSCSQIRMEIKKAESIIDSVNQDKADMTGADVVDGLLWFPFNMIAKQANYSDAVKAANARIDYLNSLAQENKCKVS